MFYKHVFLVKHDLLCARCFLPSVKILRLPGIVQFGLSHDIIYNLDLLSYIKFLNSNRHILRTANPNHCGS